MKKLIIIILLSMVLTINITLAQGGGGGAGTPITYTYQQCNELLNNEIEEWNKLNWNLRIWVRFFALFAIILVIFYIIKLGMEIQKIKDKGFKKWWRESK